MKYLQQLQERDPKRVGEVKSRDKPWGPAGLSLNPHIIPLKLWDHGQVHKKLIES